MNNILKYFLCLYMMINFNIIYYILNILTNKFIWKKSNYFLKNDLLKNCDTLCENINFVIINEGI